MGDWPARGYYTGPTQESGIPKLAHYRRTYVVREISAARSIVYLLFSRPSSTIAVHQLWGFALGVDFLMTVIFMAVS